MVIRSLLSLTIATSTFSGLRFVSWSNGLEDQMDLLTRLPPHLPISKKKGADFELERLLKRKLYLT
jgi:hypothetical protein